MSDMKQKSSYIFSYVEHKTIAIKTNRINRISCIFHFPKRRKSMGSRVFIDFIRYFMKALI